MAFQAKRRFKRSSQREGVKILTPSGTEYSTFDDLSAGGLKLWLDHDLPEQYILQLEFTLRNGSGAAMERVITVGRVVRSVKGERGFEVGVEFIDLKKNTIAAIQSLIDSEEGPF